MAESPSKTQPKETAAKSGDNLLQRLAVAGALAFTMVAGTLAATGNAFYLSRSQYAEVDHGGKQPERVTGQGIHVANPWTTYGITKFNVATEKLTLDEPGATVNLNVAYSAPEKLEPVFGNAMWLAEQRLLDVFKKNAVSYADVDTARHPLAAQQACNAMAQSLEEGLDGYLTNPKVTGCSIKLTPSA